MQAVNKKMDPQKTLKTMQDFQKENMKMGMTEDMSKHMHAQILAFTGCPNQINRNLCEWFERLRALQAGFVWQLWSHNCQVWIDVQTQATSETENVNVFDLYLADLSVCFPSLPIPLVPVNDTLDEIFDGSDDEEESQDIVNQVLDEIGIEITGKVRSTQLKDVPVGVQTSSVLPEYNPHFVPCEVRKHINPKGNQCLIFFYVRFKSFEMQFGNSP